MKVERCGLCGRYFGGLEYLTEEELNDYFSDDDYEKPVSVPEDDKNTGICFRNLKNKIKL